MARREEPTERLAARLVVIFDYGSRLQAYRAVDNYVYERVRHFLARRHKEPGRGTRRFSRPYVYGKERVLYLKSWHDVSSSKAVQ